MKKTFRFVEVTVGCRWCQQRIGAKTIGDPWRKLRNHEGECERRLVRGYFGENLTGTRRSQK